MRIEPDPPATDPASPRGWLSGLRSRVRDRALVRPAMWWSLLVVGGLSVAAGAAMLLWPGPALRVVAAVVGAWLLGAGLTRVVAALLDRSRPRDRQRLTALAGVACAAAGVVCLVHPDLTLGLLALVLAAQWLVGGIVDVVHGLRGGHRRERPWLVALGALSCVAGAVFLFWPAGSLLAFTVLTAVSAIGIGVLDIATGLRLRASPAGGGVARR